MGRNGVPPRHRLHQPVRGLLSWQFLPPLVPMNILFPRLLWRQLYPRPSPASKNKLSLVLKNLLLFGVLFILSLILYFNSSEIFWWNLFYLFSIVFGAIFALFLLVLLIMLFLRAMRR